MDLCVKQGISYSLGTVAFYPGTDIKMFVLDDGTLRILNLFLRSAGVYFERTSINGIPITLIAQKRNDNSWKIEKIGDAGASGTLDVIVSTDYYIQTSNGEFIYNNPSCYL